MYVTAVLQGQLVNCAATASGQAAQGLAATRPGLDRQGAQSGELEVLCDS